MGEYIVFTSKRSRIHRLKRWLKKFWHTKILRREWKITWKWYGGYGIVNKNHKYRLELEEKLNEAIRKAKEKR